MEAGPSTSRRGSYSLSPSAQSKPLRSTDILSPELPPTYHSLDTHQRIPNDGKDNDTERLLDGGRKGKRRSIDQEGDENSVDDGELDALRLDLDHGFHSERGGMEGEIATGEDEAMRIAGVEQRKALWWRNTLITGLFICSWSVPILLCNLSVLWTEKEKVKLMPGLGTFSQPSSRYIINGCSRRNTTDFHSPYSSLSVT